MCIRPNVSKTTQLEHKQSQKMKWMPTDNNIDTNNQSQTLILLI